VIRRLAIFFSGFALVGATAVEQPIPLDPIRQAARVADWQLSHMPKGHAAKQRTRDPKSWVQGVFFVALSELAENCNDPRYANGVIAHGEAESWNLGNRFMHADDHVIGQAWLWAFKRTRNSETIAPMRARFDAILADPPKVDLRFVANGTGLRPCQQRWCWSDALFMAPATWAGLSAATGDPRYLAYADREWWASVNALYDPVERLFYRDTRFVDERDANGRKIFWSRGNGWVFAGLARVLQKLPARHASRAEYENLFRELAARLVALQKRSGYWCASLLEANECAPETSGTALFIYGLAWGVNSGLLNSVAYDASIESGWEALVRAIDLHGRLGWVQQIGSSPQPTSFSDTQLYGVAAFLMAATTVKKWTSDRQVGKPNGPR
jgi:unsaturated rhamnogalacturonyl hydrolase